MKTIKELQEFLEQNNLLYDCNISLLFEYKNHGTIKMPIDITILEELNKKHFRKNNNLFYKIFKI